MEELKKIMMDTKISAEFDPNSKEDLDWLETQVKAILEATPALKKLETKLGKMGDVDPVLEEVLGNLKKVTNVGGMAKGGNKSNKTNKTNGTNGTNGTNATANATAAAGDGAAAAGAAATADAAAATGDAAAAAAA